MATKKISDFTATTTPSSGAEFVIVQSSSNLKVTLANIAANMPDLTATSVVSSGTVTATGGFVGNLTGNVTGNLTGVASSATALATGRTIGMTGDVTWTSASFDGSGNVTGTSTIGTGVIVNADVNTSAAIYRRSWTARLLQVMYQLRLLSQMSRQTPPVFHSLQQQRLAT